MLQTDTYLIPMLPTTIFEENDWKKDESLIGQLLPKVRKLKNLFCEIGATSAQALESVPNLPNEMLFKHYWIIYEWTTYTKEFLILCRNSFWEQEKGRVLLRDNRIMEETLQEHKAQTIGVIRKAFEDVTEAFQTAEMQFDKEKLQEWKLQKNPWSIYEKQLKLLMQQCEDIEKQTITLFDIQNHFQRIRGLVDENLETCRREINGYAQVLETVLKMIEATDKQEELTALQPKVEAINRKINLTHYHQAFSLALENHLLSLVEKKQVILGVKEGMMSVLDIAIQKRTEQWLDIETVPLLYEIWELTEDTVNGTKMALVNVRNQLILVQNQLIDGKEEEEGMIGMAITIFQKKITRTQAAVAQLEALIQKRLNQSFVVGLLYENPQDFLPVRLQDTVQPFKFKRNKIQQWFNKLVTQQTNLLYQFKRYVAHEESLSISEKVVRYIKSKGQFENDYTSIFLTKGHIGESFWVGRTTEIHRVHNIIKDWEAGFRGTVVITGKRLAGKSLFGELISHRYFLNETINLFSDTVLQIGDKSFNHNRDLKQALKFIKNQKKSEKILIWIDDLELWFSKDISLSENIRRLKKFVHANNKNYFFLISMGEWLRNHLEHFHEIGKLFQAEIKLEPMSVAEINEAILIRHNATQKALVNERGEYLSPQHFKQLTKQVSKSANGNIGEALDTWAYSMRLIDNMSVRNNFNADFTLPDFLNTEIAMVLSVFFLQKQTNQEQLRKVFGAAYQKTYAPIIKRLLGVGILKKNINGDLSVNEIIVNEVAQMLVKSGHLR